MTFGGRTGYVFRAAKGGGQDQNVAGNTLNGSGIKPAEATPHGFRRSFRNWGAENDIPRETMERSLGHAVFGR